MGRSDCSMSAGNPPPSRRTVRPASDTRRKTAAGPAASQARRCSTRHAHDRQMSPLSRQTPPLRVVHLPGEAKASKELWSCPANAPIRPIVAITQLPDLGLRILKQKPLSVAPGVVEAASQHIGTLTARIRLVNQQLKAAHRK